MDIKEIDRGLMFYFVFKIQGLNVIIVVVSLRFNIDNFINLSLILLNIYIYKLIDI